MVALFFAVVILQGIAMLVDELHFHRRRGLPRWERIGHPLDTLTLAGCLVWLLATAPSTTTLGVYAGFAIFSTLFVTKDEGVHARVCTAGEHWLHAILFALHPIVLAAFALIWWSGERMLLAGQLVITLAFCAYQIVYWNVLVDRRRGRAAERPVNNSWYAELGHRWYRAEDTPIALLRAESRHRNPWIARQIAEHVGGRGARVLDLGCGAGFLSNFLAQHGHHVTAIDTTPENLAVARLHDPTGTVAYREADACALPFDDDSFDVVCAMDLLEHVEDPARLIAEASRVLAPSGVFFFHTFNRNWLANLIVIKGVEWFVKNTPEDLHVLRLFLTPGEVTRMLRDHGLEPIHLTGSRPRFTWPLWRMLATGRVGEDFAFTFTSSTKLGYCGYACKRSSMCRKDAAMAALSSSSENGLSSSSTLSPSV